ncbi:hypothetical protein NKH18_49055 [Streptomyces sp. M10(2022)]
MFSHDPDWAPVVPAIKGAGFVINYSDPQALDWDRVQEAVDMAVSPDTRLLVVEGTFALLPALQSLARWSIYVDTPPICVSRERHSERLAMVRIQRSASAATSHTGETDIRGTLRRYKATPA